MNVPSLASIMIAFLLIQSTAAQGPDHINPSASTSSQYSQNHTPHNAAAEQDKSPSDRVNDSLPEWIRVSGQIRIRAEGITGGGFKKDSNDAYVLERLRLNIMLHPTKWVKLFVQGEDAHILGESQVLPIPPNQDSMDLRIAYLELGDSGKHRFGFRFGRQELEFGDQRLIGPANWINTPRTFDAVVGTLRTAPIRLDIFAGSAVKPHDNQFDEITPGSNLYGIYTVIPHLMPRATVEPYFLWRRQSGLKTEDGRPGIANFGTYGFRWSGKFLHGWDYGVEMAEQAGSQGSDDIQAWAGHWIAGYSFLKRPLNPRIFAEYNYASGDHNRVDTKRGTFDQLFPSAHDLYGLADQVGWRNIRHVRVGAEIKLKPKSSAGVRYNAYWLADPHDSLYNAAGVAIARSSLGNSGTYVGNELDFVVSHQLKKRMLLLAGIGHLFPGEFLLKTTPGVGFTYPYLSLNYIF